MRNHVCLLALAATCAMVLPAAAQVPCGDRGEIVKMLAEKYREKPHAVAIASQTNLLEVYASKSGSWTILVTKPRGPSCIIAAGQSWEDIPTPKELTGL